MTEKEGYAKTWAILQGDGVLTDEERAWVLGKTAAKVFAAA